MESTLSPQSSAAMKITLREYLRTLKVGTRLPAERKLAEQYGFSRATMSKVLAELEQEGLVARQVGRGTFVMPRDAIAVPAFAPTTQKEVLLVYPDFFSFEIWNEIHHLELAAMQQGFRLNHLRVQPESELDLLFRLTEQNKNIQAVIFIAGIPLRRTLLERLDNLGMPVIFIGKIEHVELYRNCHSVYGNHFLAGYGKLEMLVRNGHRRIGLVNNEPSTPAFQENMQGLKEAARNYKLPWRTLVQPDSKVEYWQDSMESGYVQTLEVMRKAPDLTALVVDTASGALGTLRALYELNLRCPDDVSIVTALAHAGIECYTCPKLTTLVTPVEKLCQTVTAIIHGHGDPTLREHRVDPVLIERESIRNLNEKSFK